LRIPAASSGDSTAEISINIFASCAPAALAAGCRWTGS